MKNLESMSISEIFEELGFGIEVEDFASIIKEDDELIAEFAKNQKSLQANSAKYKQFLVENADKISKEKIVLMTLYNFKEALKDIRPKAPISINEDNKEIKKIIEETIDKCNKLLGNKSQEAICKLIRNEQGKLELEYITQKNLNESKNKKEKSMNKIKSIEEQMSLENLLKEVPLSDMSFYGKDKKYHELYNQMIIKTIYNSLSDEMQKDSRERDNLLNPDRLLDYSKKLSFDDIKEEYIENIKKFIEYFNTDKLLLTSAFRKMLRIETSDYTKEEIEEAQKEFATLQKMLRKQENLFIEIPIVNKQEEKEEIIINKFYKKDLDTIVNKFIDGRYYKAIELKEFETKLLEGKTRLDDIDPKVCNILEFDKKEIAFLMEKDDKNCIYLLENGLVKIEKVLKNIQEDGASNELIKYLYDSGKINNDTICRLYDEGKISASSIAELKENENIQELLTNKKFIDIYDKEKDEDDKTKLQKYALLYRELKVKNKNIDELRKQTNEFLLEMDDKFDQEDIKPLYKLGIVPVETAIEWGGQGIAVEMLKEGILKPSDTKSLFESNIITRNDIENILQSIELNNTQKLDIIYSTFDEVDQGEIRNKLIQLLDVEKARKEKEYNPGELRTRQLGISKGKKTYETDPCLRYKLIATLDDKYTKELLIDGHMVFHLPNLNNGTYIIEKMFKDTKNGVKPDYGRATYILSEEDFIDNNKHIMDSDIIDRQYLIGLKEEGKAVSLNHSNKWGNNLKRELEINQSNGYTDKDLEDIDILVKNIEKSRKERE